MATEFNYVVNVDQSRVMSSAVELSSTMQMALARGMQGAQLQSPGMGAGVSDALGGAASGFNLMAGGFLGGVVGKAIGARFGLPGLGQIAGDLLGSIAGESIASDVTTQHYALMEQQRGIMSELGEIAGGGLGYTRGQRFAFGAAAA